MSLEVVTINAIRMMQNRTAIHASRQYNIFFFIKESRIFTLVDQDSFKLATRQGVYRKRKELSIF